MCEKICAFDKELSFIKNENIKKFTAESLKMLPDYFWKIPASSTGKYHNPLYGGEEGLIRHVQCAVRLAVQMFENTTIQKFNELEKDIIVSALILHDGVKHGFDGDSSKHTVSDHPLLIVQLLSKSKQLIDIIGEEVAKEIFECIKTHMGQWDFDYKTKKKVLPIPTTQIQKFVHMCDYLASRKCLAFNFDVDIQRK